MIRLLVPLLAISIVWGQTPDKSHDEHCSFAGFMWVLTADHPYRPVHPAVRKQMEELEAERARKPQPLTLTQRQMMHEAVEKSGQVFRSAGMLYDVTTGFYIPAPDAQSGDKH